MQLSVQWAAYMKHSYKIEFSFSIKVRCTINAIQKTRGLYLIGEKSNISEDKKAYKKNLLLKIKPAYLLKRNQHMTE